MDFKGQRLYKICYVKECVKTSQSTEDILDSVHLESKTCSSSYFIKTDKSCKMTSLEDKSIIHSQI